MNMEQIQAELQKIHAEYEGSFGSDLRVYGGSGLAEVFVDGARVGRGFTIEEAFKTASLGPS